MTALLISDSNASDVQLSDDEISSNSNDNICTKTNKSLKRSRDGENEFTDDEISNDLENNTDNVSVEINDVDSTNEKEELADEDSEDVHKDMIVESISPIPFYYQKEDEKFEYKVNGKKLSILVKYIEDFDQPYIFSPKQAFPGKLLKEIDLLKKYFYRDSKGKCIKEKRSSHRKKKAKKESIHIYYK